MLRQFLAFYRPHRRLLLLDFGCAALSGMLELGFPMAVRGFVDHLLPGGDLALILLAVAALLRVYLLNGALMAVVTYWGHVLGIAIETELRRRAFDHLMKLSFRFYDGQKTGHLVGRLTKDLEEIGEVAHHGPEDLLIAVADLRRRLRADALRERPLALLTLLVMPAAAFVIARYGARMTANWQAQFGRVGAFNARIEEAVGGIRVVKAFANEDQERRLFAADNDAYRRVKLDGYRAMATGITLNYIGLRAVQVAVMLAGSVLIVQGAMSVGDFVAFLLLVGVLYRPLDKIAAVIETYPKGIAGFRRYLDLLAIAPDIVDRPGARPAPPLQGALRFEGVGFGYSGPARAAGRGPLHRAGGDGGAGRPFGRGQDHAALAAAALLRGGGGASPSTASTSAT
jgi:ATP-binding cassette subfamily B protein